MSSVSILILTLNEEANLPACLESVKWSDDIVVLDSFSTDRTVEIAKGAGARVIQRRFDNWAAHQNWACGNIEFRHPWVFYLDADERITEELRDEAAAIAENPNEPLVAYYCGRRNYFMGRWLKHAFRTEGVMRFFRPEKVRFERLVNPTPVIDGQSGCLRAQFIHHAFSKGITDWIDRHNKYSLLEAMEGLKVIRGQSGPAPSLLSRDRFKRRQALKALSFRLPFRPTLRFLYMYLWCLGFLDGYPGLTYCRLVATYEWMIVLKMRELQRRKKGLPM